METLGTLFSECKTMKAVIKYDSEWQEFKVLFYVNGRHIKDADYMTTDRKDAFDTANNWILPKLPVFNS